LYSASEKADAPTRDFALTEGGDTEGSRILGRAAAGVGRAARNDLQVNSVCCMGLVENEVQDNQYDQRDAKKPAKKVRHDVISFRINV